MLFEAADLVFQEVDQGNDYGKDAYVDLTSRGTLSGECIALQIKGGSSYRRHCGYAIDFDPATGRLWANSSVPVFGIVHDPADGKLRWCNLTAYMRTAWSGRSSGSVPIEHERVLDEGNLTFFLEAASLYVRAHGGSYSLLDLMDADADRQMAAVLRCFALGRSDARALLLLRSSISRLHDQALDAALTALVHVVRHPDIIWSQSNWISDDIRERVVDSLTWSESELSGILAAAPWDRWERDDLGSGVYMLLDADPEIKAKLTSIALGRGDFESRWVCLYLLTYWAGGNGAAVFAELTARAPELLNHPLADEVVSLLQEFGYVTLW